MVFDSPSGKFVALVDAAKAGSWPHSSESLRSITAFLGLGRDARRAAAELVASVVDTLGIGEDSVEERLPIKVQSLRDAALYYRHMAQAAAGFVPVALNNGHVVQFVMAHVLGKNMRRVPSFLPSPASASIEGGCLLSRAFSRKPALLCPPPRALRAPRRGAIPTSCVGSRRTWGPAACRRSTSVTRRR